MKNLNKLMLRFKNYDPKKYWSKRSNPNNKAGEEVTHARHVDYITEHTRGAKKIFELGPGVGRTFDAYQKGSELICLDISRNYEQTAQAVAKKFGLDFSLEEMMDGVSAFPFSDASFEVGVASQVFLHVPKSDINHYLSECLRVCKKLVVITSYKHNPVSSLINLSSNHVFNHNYLEICTNLDFRIDDVKWSNDQIYFVISS